MKKNLHTFVLLISLLALVSLTTRCGEDDPEKKSIAEITTSEVTDVTQITATSGGTITPSDGEEIEARGVCWSTTSNPTIADNKTIDGTGSGNFTSTIAELIAGQTYHVRAYASNANGIVYGNNVSFTTDAATIPVVTTLSVEDITLNSARVYGSITSDGGGTLTAYGICWSRNENPTISDAKTTRTNIPESPFSTVISILNPNTRFFARAYATNEAGTGYGDQIMFTTQSTLQGIYEVIEGSITRNTPTGPDPVLGGDYVEGLEVLLSQIDDNSVGFQPMWKDGSAIGGVDGTRITIDKTITLPDGSHPVTISCPVNPSVQNTPSSQNKFFPGIPGESPYEFLLNFQWGSAPNLRIVTNLRLRYNREP